MGKEHKPFQEVLLATAVLKILDSRGREIMCRALLDNGSQMHFMTAELANRLILPLHNFNMSITGLGNTETEGSKVVSSE